MNWLIYIAGWWWGLALTNSFFHDDVYMGFKLVIWTMTWVWFCWRFIS